MEAINQYTASVYAIQVQLSSKYYTHVIYIF